MFPGLDARLVQLSASPGNQALSQRGDQALYLLGNKTSKDGRVEQNVYFVGSSFNTEQISKLEREIELLREKKETQISRHDKDVPKGTGLTESPHRSEVKLKENAEIVETSAVIDRTKQDSKAFSVIKDKSKGVVQNVASDFGEFGIKVSENLGNNVRVDSHATELRSESDLTGSHVPQSITQTKTDKNATQFLDNDSHIHKTLTEEIHVEDTLVAQTETFKDKLTETTVPKKKVIKEKKKSSKLKVVSKPAHVTSVDKGKSSEEEKGLKTKSNKAKQSMKKKVENKENVKHSETHKKKATMQKKAEERDKSVGEHTMKIFNKDFRAFVDACCCIGLVSSLC